MPFFPPVVHSEKHKKIKLGCDSLQVQKPKKYKEKIKKINVSQGKRVYLFTSKGSITLEAAINNFYVGNSFGDKLHNSS